MGRPKKIVETKTQLSKTEIQEIVKAVAVATVAQLEPLQKELREALSEAKYREGRVDELQERLNKYERQERNTADAMMVEHQRLEDQVRWLRKLIEIMVIPEDKLKRIDGLIDEAMGRGRYR